VLIAPPTFRRLVRAHELLVSDAHDAVTVRTIAKQLKLSPFHFIRQFAAVYGSTPHQLRTQARIERAKRLLAVGTPVTEVCLQVGFSSLGSFSALFTRWVGASPTHYRRSVQVPRNFGRVLVPGCFGLMGQLPRNSREATPL
jgi:AraC-like DNA-binding protein